MFISLEQALENLKSGKMILLADEKDRENEADLICSADLLNVNHLNFMINYAKGLVCVPLSETLAQKIGLELMIKENQGTLKTAFTVSIDAKQGITSGISSRDRVATIKTLLQPNVTINDFEIPGHVFPLIAHKDGLNIRKGHTEAAVKLMELINHSPVAVICETLDENGEPLRGQSLMDFSLKHGIGILKISELL